MIPMGLAAQVKETWPGIGLNAATFGLFGAASATSSFIEPTLHLVSLGGAIFASIATGIYYLAKTVSEHRKRKHAAARRADYSARRKKKSK